MALEGSGRQLIDRVLAGFHDIVERHRGATVAVVSHGGVLDVVYRAARALPWQAPREHQMLNASINRLSASAPPFSMSIVSWGDVGHLAEARDERSPEPVAVCGRCTRPTRRMDTTLGLIGTFALSTGIGLLVGPSASATRRRRPACGRSR
jgi:hypothetical protein